MPVLQLDVQPLLDAHELPFVLIGPEYRIVAANQAYCEVHDIHPARVAGRTCHEVAYHSPVPCHVRGEPCPFVAVAATGEGQVVLHSRMGPGGRAEHQRLRGFPVRGPDGVLLMGELSSRVAATAEMDCEEIRMIGRSPAFLACVDNLSRVAESEASILLFGESGVGKELAAQYIHKRSLRREKPFLAVNCASIPETLFESEFFGHEKGAFTGSMGRKQGLFELADGGTLFLDEVGEIPLSMQAKLLRVLETGEFRRVGGKETLFTDVRVVSATNRDLLEMVDQGRFRQDLYYRIAGIDVTLPPLRERRADIPALAEMFLRRISAEMGRESRLSEDALIRLADYAFPGNVRELRNILQKAAALSPGGFITAARLGLDGPASAVAAAPFVPAPPPPPTEDGLTMSELEATYIEELLRRHNGHRRRVADALGISERTLYRKLNRYRLNDQKGAS